MNAERIISFSFEIDIYWWMGIETKKPNRKNRKIETNLIIINQSRLFSSILWVIITLLFFNDYNRDIKDLFFGSFNVFSLTHIKKHLVVSKLMLISGRTFYIYFFFISYDTIVCFYDWLTQLKRTEYYME